MAKILYIEDIQDNITLVEKIVKSHGLGLRERAADGGHARGTWHGRVRGSAISDPRVSSTAVVA